MGRCDVKPRSYPSHELNSSGLELLWFVYQPLFSFFSKYLCARPRKAEAVGMNFYFLGDRYKWRFAVCYGTVVLSVMYVLSLLSA